MANATLIFVILCGIFVLKRTSIGRILEAELVINVLFITHLTDVIFISTRDTYKSLGVIFKMNLNTVITPLQYV